MSREEYQIDDVGLVLPQESRRGDNGGRGEDVLILIARLGERKKERKSSSFVYYHHR